MKRQVRVTDDAAVQIEQAASWWAEARSLEQALRWVAEMESHIAGLGTSPERHGLARESSRFPFEVRESLFGTGRRITHRILFRITDDVVEILAVRHVARDQARPNDE